MRVGNFSVLISEGKELDSGHVELAHGAVYSIKILNHCCTRRCDAALRVDGKDIGLFRVDKGGWIELERPLTSTGKFTFFKADSHEAHEAGVAGVSKDDCGLIQVVFKLEKIAPPQKVYRSSHMSKGGPCGQSVDSNNSASPDSVDLCSLHGAEKTTAGITGLTGHSSQTFYEVPNLDYDPTEEVTISLRLVCGSEVRPLEPLRKANPIPASVD